MNSLYDNKSLLNKKLNCRYINYKPIKSSIPFQQGTKLLEAKQKNSEWTSLLPFSATTAYRRMRIAKYVNKYPEIASMTQEKALKYLTKMKKQEKLKKNFETKKE